jgi:hypothetical protein
MILVLYTWSSLSLIVHRIYGEALIFDLAAQAGFLPYLKVHLYMSNLIIELLFIKLK